MGSRVACLVFFCEGCVCLGWGFLIRDNYRFGRIKYIDFFVGNFRVRGWLRLEVFWGEEFG